MRVSPIQLRGHEPEPREASFHEGEQPAPTGQLFGIIWRRKYSILATGLLLNCLPLAAVRLHHPSFVASASVLLQEHSTSVAGMVMDGGHSATDSVAVRTQADILHSFDLANSVVRKLDLIDRPEFQAHPGRMTKLRGVLRSQLVAPYLGEAAAEDLLGPPHSDKPLTTSERERLATQVLLGMTTIVNDGRSYVIDIKVKVSSDAAHAEQAASLSAALANAYADAYVAFTGQVKLNSIRQANAFFDERLQSLQQKMRETQRAVQTYRTENGLVEDRGAGGAGRPVTIAGQQMAQINGDLIAATSDLALKEASLEQLSRARAGKADLQSVPEVVASPVIHSLRAQQAELGAREASLATTRGDYSPDLVALRASLRDVSAKIAAETGKIAESLRNAAAAARLRQTALHDELERLTTQVSAQGQTEVQLNELQNEADTAQLIYATYLKRSQETANEINMQEPDALLVSRAPVPLQPVPPSALALTMMGAVVSFGLATLLALVRERLRAGFRTIEELEAATGVAALGYLPRVRRLRQVLRFNPPYTAFAEAVASARALLRLYEPQHARVVMVTSALPREGKTVFCSSLARNAAQAGERVLLIDCDLRRPAVARTIAVKDGVAFGELTIRRDRLSSLDVLTLPRGAGTPQDRFSSPVMRELIDMVRTRYDLVLLDTPPVLAVSDARVLSKLADATVFVVRWQSTPKQLVNTALGLLRRSGATITGAVITQVRLSELHSSDGAYGYVHRAAPRIQLR